MLRDAIGKWHLGRGDKFGPDKQGYDFAAEINGPHLPGRFRATDPAIAKPAPDQFRTDYESDLCELFIRKNKDKPFFLMLSPYAVHIPLASKSKLVEKYRKRAKERTAPFPTPSTPDWSRKWMIRSVGSFGPWKISN